MDNKPDYMNEGTFQQLKRTGASDLYMWGNPQNGCWRYGEKYGSRNPYCPTLQYTIIDYNQVHANNEYLDPKLKNSFEETYKGNKILPNDFLINNYIQYSREISTKNNNNNATRGRRTK